MNGGQLSINLYKGNWGGRRPGTGRKRKHSKGVAHRKREIVNTRTPLHINFKYRTHIKNKLCLKLLKKAIINARSHGLKIIHFSLQSNHIHLIIESANNEILTKGMRSLTITFAKGLKKGRVQIERYHLHVLRTIREAKNAVLYVVFNKQKHEKGRYSRIDEYTSIHHLDKALKIMSNFAKTRRLTLAFTRSERWPLDKGQSFILKKGIETLSKD